jgi:hypothetical protein
MIVTTAQASDSLAAHAEAGNEKREIPNSKRSLESDETTRPKEEDRPGRDSFFDHLRRALSVPHM